MKHWRVQAEDLLDAFYVEAVTEGEAIKRYREEWEATMARRKKEVGYWWRDYGPGPVLY